ncbi:MAG: ABC transporter permease, partial [Actinomycetota bacterium]|nr:ABC transporter permease [Actinomycetota bacterium]
MWLLLVVAGLLVLSLVRVLAGARDLTSSGTVQAALTAAVPIAMAALAGLWAERAGVINIGLEGMMVLGTFGAGYAGYQWGPWAGVAFGLFLGVVGGLLHALATVTFGVDHIISGVAINLLAPGAALFLSKLYFAKAPGGG